MWSNFRGGDTGRGEGHDDKRRDGGPADGVTRPGVDGAESPELEAQAGGAPAPESAHSDRSPLRLAGGIEPLVGLTGSAAAAASAASAEPAGAPAGPDAAEAVDAVAEASFAALDPASEADSEPEIDAATDAFDEPVAVAVALDADDVDSGEIASDGADAAADVPTPAPASGSIADGPSVEAAFSDVERHLQVLRDVQQRHEARELAVNEQESSLRQRRTELDERASELQERATSLDEHRERLVRDREALDAERAALDASRSEETERLEELRTAAEAAQAELAAEKSALGDARAELTREQEQLEAAHQALAEEQEAIASSAADRAAFEVQITELEARERDLTERAAAVATESAEVDAARRAVDATRASLEDREQRLAERTEALEAAEAEIAGARADLDRDESALTAERDRLAAKVMLLEAAVAEARASAADTSDLEAARAEARAAAERVAGLEARVSEARAEGERIAAALTEELDQLRASLEARTHDLAEADARLKRATATEREASEKLAAQLAATDAELAARRQELEDLRAEAARSAGEAEAGATDHGARIERLEAELDSLRTERDVARAAADAADEARTAAETKIREAESARDEAQARADAAIAAGAAAPAPSPAGADPEAIERATAELRERARRVAVFAEHLNRRRERLQRMRLLVDMERSDVRDEKSPGSDGVRNMGIKLEPGQRIVDLEDQMAAEREIERQRQEVRDRRRDLAKAEKLMVRRWARPRALSTVLSIAAMAALSLAAGWFAADQIAPPVRTAAVTLAAETELPRHRTDEVLAKFGEWHRDRLGEAAFLNIAAERMASVRLDDFRTAEKLGARLEQDLTVSTTNDGRVTLTLAGTNPAELVAILDVVAVSLGTDSMRTFKGRSDAAWAKPSGERQEGGAYRYATVNDVPVSDTRMQTAGPIAGGTFGGLMLLTFVCFARLIRVRRELDDDGTLFADSTSLGMVESM